MFTKRELLTVYLKTHPFVSEEGKALLRYLLEKEELLEKVRFVSRMDETFDQTTLFISSRSWINDRGKVYDMEVGLIPLFKSLAFDTLYICLDIQDPIVKKMKAITA
jgi:predicted thioredoxin/glutaredoxin